MQRIAVCKHDLPLKKKKKKKKKSIAVPAHSPDARLGGSKAIGLGQSSLTQKAHATVFLFGGGGGQEGHAYRSSARPQRKHAKPRCRRLLRGGRPAREPMTGQHAHMQANRTAAAQGLLRFASAHKEPCHAMACHDSACSRAARNNYLLLPCMVAAGVVAAAINRLLLPNIYVRAHILGVEL